MINPNQFFTSQQKSGINVFFSGISQTLDTCTAKESELFMHLLKCKDKKTT